jgi:hypothetical protein
MSLTNRVPEPDGKVSTNKRYDPGTGYIETFYIAAQGIETCIMEPIVI